jgi:hypothetical protein
MLFDALNAVSCPASIAEEAPLVQGTEMRQTARDRPLYFCMISRIPTCPEDGVGVAISRQLELEGT